MDEVNDEDTSASGPGPKTGITTADHDRIQKYLDKPAHLRTLQDLIPDADTSAD